MQTERRRGAPKRTTSHRPVSQSAADSPARADRQFSRIPQHKALRFSLVGVSFFRSLSSILPPPPPPPPSHYKRRGQYRTVSGNRSSCYRGCQNGLDWKIYHLFFHPASSYVFLSFLFCFVLSRLAGFCYRFLVLFCVQSERVS